MDKLIKSEKPGNNGFEMRNGLMDMEGLLGSYTNYGQNDLPMDLATGKFEKFTKSDKRK
jgi:hypothetical protein